MQIFDVHVHIFPDKIAERTVAAIGDASGIQASCNGTRSELLGALQRATIDGALNCPIATKPDQVDSINQWAADQNRWPIMSLGSIHPDYPDIEGCIRFLLDSGLPGIKLHPEYQAFRLDDARMQPVWKACNRHNPVIARSNSVADLTFPACCCGNHRFKPEKLKM